MNLLKKPVVNVLFIGLISTFYSFVFIFTADHIEFLRMLSHQQTLNVLFWNAWSSFIKSGNMRFIGYLIIVLTSIIIVFIFIKRRKKYDEYQVSVLSKSLIVSGIISILMIPFIMILVLSDPN